DAAGEHHEGLTGCEQPQHGGVQECRRHLPRREERTVALCTIDDVGSDEERDEDQRQDERRVVDRELAHRPAHRSGRRRHEPFAFCRTASPPIITTSTISAPWITWA